MPPFSGSPASTIPGRPRKAAERAFALGDEDPFDYELALRLGQPLAVVRAFPHDEYLRWRAYMNVRSRLRDHAAAVAAARGQG